MKKDFVMHLMRMTLVIVMFFCGAGRMAAQRITIAEEVLTYDVDGETLMPNVESGTAVIRTGESIYDYKTYTSYLWSDIAIDYSAKAVATPARGYKFKEWRVSNGEPDAVLDNPASSETSIKKPSADVTLTAVFQALPQLDLTENLDLYCIVKDDDGNVRLGEEGIYKISGHVTITGNLIIDKHTTIDFDDNDGVLSSSLTVNGEVRISGSGALLEFLCSRVVVYSDFSAIPKQVETKLDDPHYNRQGKIDALSGKTFAGFNGLLVSTTADGISVGTLSGTTFTAADSDFTITTDAGTESEVTTPYYVYNAGTEDVSVYYSTDFSNSYFKSVKWDVTGTTLDSYDYFAEGGLRNMENRYATFTVGTSDVTVEVDGNDLNDYYMPGGGISGSDGGVWWLNEDGSVLCLSGCGPMGGDASWPNYHFKSFQVVEGSFDSIGGFAGCTSLESAYISESNINAGAFAGCTSLTSVTIANNTGEMLIYGEPFSGCTNLSNIRITGNVPSLFSGINYFGDNIKAIIVDEGMYGSFVDDTYWTNYVAKIAPASVTLSSLNTSGWATYCHGWPVSYNIADGNDGDELPDGTVHTVTGLNSTNTGVTISSPLSNIEPYTPVLLQYDGTATTSLTLTADASTAATPTSTDAVSSDTGWSYYGNATGTTQKHNPDSDPDDGIPALTGGWPTYILRNGNFVLVDTDEGIPAHRCVLSVGSSSAARVLAIGIDDEKTGMTPPLTPPLEGAGSEGGYNAGAVWYTIDGRKLNKAPIRKGICIHNGKKVVMK